MKPPRAQRKETDGKSPTATRAVQKNGRRRQTRRGAAKSKRTDSDAPEEGDEEVKTHRVHINQGTSKTCRARAARPSVRAHCQEASDDQKKKQHIERANRKNNRESENQGSERNEGAIRWFAQGDALIEWHTMS